MTQTTGKILKSDQVNFEGSYQLGLSQANHSTPENMNTIVKSPQVKILENNKGYVVIQVTCTCGKQIILRGEYNESQNNVEAN